MDRIFIYAEVHKIQTALSLHLYFIRFIIVYGI